MRDVSEDKPLSDVSSLPACRSSSVRPLYPFIPCYAKKRGLTCSYLLPALPLLITSGLADVQLRSAGRASKVVGTSACVYDGLHRLDTSRRDDETRQAAWRAQQPLRNPVLGSRAIQANGSGHRSDTLPEPCGYRGGKP